MLLLFPFSDSLVPTNGLLRPLIDAPEFHVLLGKLNVEELLAGLHSSVYLLEVLVQVLCLLVQLLVFCIKQSLFQVFSFRSRLFNNYLIVIIIIFFLLSSRFPLLSHEIIFGRSLLFLHLFELSSIFFILRLLGLLLLELPLDLPHVVANLCIVHGLVLLLTVSDWLVRVDFALCSCMVLQVSIHISFSVFPLLGPG